MSSLYLVKVGYAAMTQNISRI